MRIARWIAEPHGQRVINGVLAVVFAVQIPVALATGLKDSVPYLVFLSLWALVGAHWSASLAAAAADEAAHGDNNSER